MSAANVLRLKSTTLFRLLAQVRPYRGRLFLAVGASLVCAGAAAAYAYLVGPLVKAVLQGGALRPFHGLPAEQALPLAIVVLAGVKAAASYLQGGWMMGAGQRVIADLRARLHGQLLALPPAFFERRHSGDLMSRFSSDVAQVEFALTQALASYVKDGLTILALVGLCFWIDWRLFLLAFVVLPADVLAVSRFSKAVKRIAREAQGTLGEVTAQAAEQLANLTVVRAFDAEGRALSRFDRAQDRYLQAMRRSLFLRGAYSPTVEVLGTVGVAFALFFGARAIAVDPGLAEKLVTFLSAALLLYPPVKSISGTLSLTVQGLAAAERLFEIEDAPPAKDGTREAAPLSRALDFEDVVFTYPDGRTALSGLSLTLRRGEKVALVGSSGAGKSTAVALALGFSAPTSGRILWDGVPLEALARASLRAQLAWVPQEPALFSGTVRENLCLGIAPAADELLWESLARAGADGFVRALPSGLEERLGEAGARLSGGQRQRLAIARAFLRRPSLLLLDEPTSALDAQSERAVQAGLDALLEGRTALIVAHRLSTVRDADRIYVLEGGRVVEEGTHASLTQRGGRYVALLKAGELAA